MKFVFYNNDDILERKKNLMSLTEDYLDKSSTPYFLGSSLGSRLFRYIKVYIIVEYVVHFSHTYQNKCFLIFWVLQQNLAIYVWGYNLFGYPTDLIIMTMQLIASKEIVVFKHSTRIGICYADKFLNLQNKIKLVRFLNLVSFCVYGNTHAQSIFYIHFNISNFV
jgi:hypothetical protein